MTHCGQQPSGQPSNAGTCFTHFLTRYDNSITHTRTCHGISVWSISRLWPSGHAASVPQPHSSPVCGIQCRLDRVCAFCSSDTPLWACHKHMDCASHGGGHPAAAAHKVHGIHHAQAGTCLLVSSLCIVVSASSLSSAICLNCSPLSATANDAVAAVCVEGHWQAPRINHLPSESKATACSQLRTCCGRCGEIKVQL